MAARARRRSGHGALMRPAHASQCRPPGRLSSHAAWSTPGLRWGAQRRLRSGRQPGRGGGRPAPCWTRVVYA